MDARHRGRREASLPAFSPIERGARRRIASPAPATAAAEKVEIHEMRMEDEHHENALLLPRASKSSRAPTVTMKPGAVPPDDLRLKQRLLPRRDHPGDAEFCQAAPSRWSFRSRALSRHGPAPCVSSCRNRPQRQLLNGSNRKGPG